MGCPAEDEPDFFTWEHERVCLRSLFMLFFWRFSANNRKDGALCATGSFQISISLTF